MWMGLASTKTYLIVTAVSVLVLLIGGVAWGIQGIRDAKHPVLASGDRYLDGRSEAVQHPAIPDAIIAPSSTPADPGPVPPETSRGPAQAPRAPRESRSSSPGSIFSGINNFGSGGASFNCGAAKLMYAGMSQHVECDGAGHQGFTGDIRLSCTAPAGMTCELSKTVVSPPPQFNGGTTSVPVTVRVFVPKGFPSGQHSIRLHYDAPTADPRIPHNEGVLPINVMDTSYFANCGPLTLAAGSEGKAGCLVMIPAGSYRGPIYLSVLSLTPGGPQPVLATDSVADANMIQVPIRFNAASVAPGTYTYELATTHIEGGPPEPHKPGAPMMTNRFIVTVTP